MSVADPGEAWRDLCERMAALASGLDAEGARHVARHLALALVEQVDHGDPMHPMFHRSEEPWAQWGGPNPDNVYTRAKVEPSGTYRVWGDVTGLRQAIFSLHEGDMHEGRPGVFSERTLDTFDVGADGTLEIWISPDDPGGHANWMPMHERARHVLVRQYQSDWEGDAIATFSIERADSRGIPPVAPPEGDTVMAALDRAAAWVEQSMRFWAEYTAASSAALPRNTFTAPSTPPGGAPTIGYGAGWFVLGPDDALVIDHDVPDADYWTWTLHTDRFLESGDFADRQTSLNHVQAHVDGDGRVRLVAARRDPGVPNWIDVEDRAEGMLVYRYIGARTKPVPEGRVVPLDAVHEQMPADHPTVESDERRDQLARRRAAILRRYV